MELVEHFHLRSELSSLADENHQRLTRSQQRQWLVLRANDSKHWRIPT